MEVISNISKDAANAYLYGLNNANIDYFRNEYEILKGTLVQNSPLVNTHMGFLNKIDYLTSNNYVNDVKNALYNLNITGKDDYNIYYYNNPNDANEITRKYIMANPKLDSLYQRGLIEGYSDKYIRNDVDIANKYATVMNGELDDNNQFVTYYGYELEDISEDDKELVRLNWANCKKLLKDDIDPTAL